MKILSNDNSVLIFREMITNNRIAHRTMRARVTTTTIPLRSRRSATCATITRPIAASGQSRYGRTKYRVNGSPARPDRSPGPLAARLSPLLCALVRPTRAAAKTRYLGNPTVLSPALSSRNQEKHSYQKKAPMYPK